MLLFSKIILISAEYFLSNAHHYNLMIATQVTNKMIIIIIII